VTSELSRLDDLHRLPAGPTGARPGRVRGTFTLATPAPADEPGPRPAAVPAAPTGVAAAGSPWAGLAASMSSTLVAEVRQRAADRLVGVLDGHGEREQRERAAPVVSAIVAEEAAFFVRDAGQHWTEAQTRSLVRVVLDELVGLGRLQPLVEDPQVNNANICGCEPVVLELADGRRVQADPVADSDADLVDYVRFLAGRDESNPRDFSPATPYLRMSLGEGIRLAAAAWVVPRPVVVIRRHRVSRWTLRELVRVGSLTPLAASFLSAAVKDGRSIVVSGRMNAGKTTLMRALCAEIPFHEVVMTVETDRELFLDKIEGQHIRVIPFEARRGSAELRADGSRAGEFSMQEALRASKAMSVERQIVGEVLGAEVLDMLDAMRSSRGSISTVHADSAAETVSRLVSLAMRAGPQITAEYATREVVSGLDLVVFANDAVTVAGDGSLRSHRWVSDIVAVAPGEGADGTASTAVFTSHGRRGPAVPAQWPDGQGYDRLVELGFDRAAFDAARPW
jgi:Flp pilus assembly CpaF family ATPase